MTYKKGLVLISGGTREGASHLTKDMLLNGSILSCEELLQKAVAASSAFHFPFLKYPRNLITRQAWVSQSTQK